MRERERERREERERGREREREVERERENVYLFFLEIVILHTESLCNCIPLRVPLLLSLPLYSLPFPVPLADA